jgi:hypothetical protein
MDSGDKIFDVLADAAEPKVGQSREDNRNLQREMSVLWARPVRARSGGAETERKIFEVGHRGEV